MIHHLGILLLCILIPTASLAFVKVEGQFTAGSACQATVSLHNRTRPVTLRRDTTYRVLGRNAPDGAFIQLDVPHAHPPARWVPLTCGHLIGAEPPDSDSLRLPAAFGQYVFAISWQPAFCQNHQGKQECRTQTADRFDASHFTLHGLWPDGVEYCQVSRDLQQRDRASKWEDLPEPILTTSTRQVLDRVMPGTQSLLHRHEWIKHGVCDGSGSEAYFMQSVALLEQINGSSVRNFFVQHIGQRVTLDAVRTAFVQAFGAEARNNVALNCSNGLIEEIQITLRAPIPPEGSLSSLFASRRKAKPSTCSQGRIDPVGF